MGRKGQWYAAELERARNQLSARLSWANPYLCAEEHAIVRA